MWQTIFSLICSAGYCDYYATAFIVMARSLGIPARTGNRLCGWQLGLFTDAVDNHRSAGAFVARSLLSTIWLDPL